MALPSEQIDLIINGVKKALQPDFDSIRGDMASVIGKVDKIEKRQDILEKRINQMDLLLKVRSPASMTSILQTSISQPTTQNSAITGFEDRVINNLNIPIRCDPNVPSVPISNLRQTVRRMLANKMEPYRTVHLLDCPKSTKYTRPSESRLYDRQATLRLLERIVPDLKEQDILFIKRDPSSKEDNAAIIVGLRDPGAYILQQAILAGAKKNRLEKRIITPPEKLTKRTETQQYQRMEVEMEDEPSWLNPQESWADTMDTW